MNKKLLILRGVSGSGKSTYAKQSLKNAYKDGYLAVDTWSADNYFVRPDGIYDFNGKMLKNAHKCCRVGVEVSMDDEIDLIILDNTNTRHWEYKDYLDLAEKYDYEVEIKVIGEFDKKSVQKYAERNSHGVPIEKVHEMAGRFEF